MPLPVPAESNAKAEGGVPHVRRYPEIDADVQRRERKVREAVQAAPFARAGVGGITAVALMFLFTVQKWESVGMFEAAAVGLLVALLQCWSMRQRGLARILEAQRTLILIDTEENTRRTAEALERRS
jgi:hypothetical protein